MTNLFKPPKIEKPPSPPSVDDARSNLDIRKQLAARKGRASAIIAGQSDTGTASGPATKILLGQ